MPRLSAEAVRAAAGLVLEAVQEGGTLPPFPASWAPTTAAQGRRIAAVVIGELGVPVVGLRLAPVPALGGQALGPVLAPRLLHGPVAVPRGERRTITLALVAQLGESLPARERAYSRRFALGRLASLHVALDLGETRFTKGPPDLPSHLADLAGLGLVVFGKPARAGWREAIAEPLAATVAGDGGTVWRGEIEGARALIAAADAARLAGGLPAGAVLVVAGLSPPLPDEAIEARIRRLGSVRRDAV